MTISQIPTLRAHIWQTMVLGDLPSEMAISQIPTLRAHIWQTRSWHIYLPPWKLAISQIPTLRVHIWHVPCLGQIHLSLSVSEWQFHRFLLWGLIFGRPGLSRSIPTPCVSNGNVTDSYSERLIFGRPGLRQIFIPHQTVQFHRFPL